MIESICILALGLTYKVTKSLYPYLHRMQIPPKNKYVLLTGCTDGIGKQFAKFLNTHSVPTILVGRNKQKLDQLLDQLSKQKQQQPLHKTLIIDFEKSQTSLAKYQASLQSLNLQNQSISGIVNCCGVAMLSKFSELEWEAIQKTKNTNTKSLQLSLKSFSMSIFSSNPFLINISSYTAHYPLKYSSVYSASKAYMANLLQAYRSQNPKTEILDVQPWYVTTKMTGFRKGWDCVQAEEVVKGSFKALGNTKNCTGTIKHEFIKQFGYFFQKFYFPGKIEENYSRYEKLKQLKKQRQKRSRKQ